MEKQWIGLLAVICMLVAGCAYKVGARAAPAGNIYSIHDSKIPGKYALQVTGLDNCCRMEVRPSSYICGAHNFPVNASEAIRWSIQHTLSLVFENIDLNDGQGNVVTISVNRFDPKLRFVPGFWSGQASSTVEIGIDVKAMRNGKVVLNTAVFAERTRDGDAGPYCSGGAEVIAEAIASATREVMERMAERLSNNPALRTTD